MSVAGIDKTKTNTEETTTTKTSKSQPQQQTTLKSETPQTKRKRNIKNGSIDYDSTTDSDNTESFYQKYKYSAF
jgi:hypothetical protein